MKGKLGIRLLSGLLPDLIEQDDRTQLDRYLTIYRQAFPETEQMKDVLTAWIRSVTTRRRWTNWTRNTVGLLRAVMSGAISAVDMGGGAHVFYLQYKLKTLPRTAKQRHQRSGRGNRRGAGVADRYL